MLLNIKVKVNYQTEPLFIFHLIMTVIIKCYSLDIKNGTFVGFQEIIPLLIIQKINALFGTSNVLLPTKIF